MKKKYINIMAIKNKKRSTLPTILSLGFLILLILLLGLYFENCLKKAVLGVSTFNSSSSKNPVTNGETFNFTATVVGDQAGALNATVLFSLTGQGVINNNIQGPGACLKITDTTAACNNVNVDPNQTITWTVPVTASSNCSQTSPATLTLQTRLIATVVTSTSTASTNCVANQPLPTPSATTNATTSPTTTGGGSGTNTTPGTGANNTTNTTSTTNGGGGINQAPATPTPGTFDFAGFACTKISGFPLILLLFILWLLVTAYYFIFRKKN